MALQNIVRIDEISECVERTIAGVREGVAAARRAGIQVELPAEITFEMIVIKDFQLLEVETSENGTTQEIQGGESRETRVTTGEEDQNRTDTTTRDESTNRKTSDATTDTRTQNGTRTSNNSNAHNEHNEEQYYYDA